MKVLLFLIFLSACSGPKKQNINSNEFDESFSARKFTKSAREYEGKVQFKDQAEKLQLIQALNQNIQYLKKTIKRPIIFGDRKISKIKYIRLLNQFKNLVKHSFDDPSFSEKVSELFQVYEVFGKSKWGEVLITGYYTPPIMVSKIKDNKFSTPIYKFPKDMNVKNLTRKDIDGDKVLEGKNLVLAYADPIDVFFLHIQGSGVGVFRNGTKAYFHFDGHNSKKYYSIGKSLYDIIPKEEMSMQKIKAHLKTLSEEDRNKIFFKNPRYIFFREENQRPRTFVNSLPIKGRTIASDRKHFPKGIIGFLELPSTEKIKSRFIVDHDIGGGVKGPYRVDLYMGEGSEGEIAGKLREHGNLFYLLPKKSF